MKKTIQARGPIVAHTNAINMRSSGKNPLKITPPMELNKIIATISIDF